MPFAHFWLWGGVVGCSGLAGKGPYKKEGGLLGAGAPYKREGEGKPYKREGRAGKPYKREGREAV